MASETGNKLRRFKEKSSLLRRFHPKGVAWGANRDDFDPYAVRATIRSMGRLFGPGRYFRVDAQGWENLPPPPVMLVSNHSGGTLFLDSWGLLYAWYTHFESERAIHPAVHELLLGNDKTAPYFAKRGAVQANKHVAERVLSNWQRDLLVMPGGDFDVWRPHRDRYRVRFAGHNGYARIAIAAGVPIVPVANAGAHDTLYVLSDGHRLASLLRLPKLVRAHIWPLHLSLPWGLAFGPWPHIPLPVTLRYRMGPAIYPEANSAKPLEQQVAELDLRVRKGVQAQLDRLAT